MSNKKAIDIDVQSEDNIVISGIAGRFPKSNNIRQLQENLFNKVDVGSNEERRWNHGNIFFCSMKIKNDIKNIAETYL